MSVQLLKPPSTADSPQPQALLQLPGALEQLHHWAQVSPLHNALRHKRHGHWYAWRWIDVLRDVERLADGLHQQGFNQHSRLALSALFEPDLLLLALAALSIGGKVLSIDHELGPEALHQALWRLRPTHALVDSRQQVLRWLAAGERCMAPQLLIARQAQPRLPATSSGRLRVFSELLQPRETPRRQTCWRHPIGAAQLWSEEGTEWQGGLAVLLEQWLSSGHSLAFPEARRSACRDRRDVAPSGLLLSPQRLQHLANQIERRLAPADNWRRRLCEWVIAHSHRTLPGLLIQSARRLLGFQRLQFIWQPPSSPQPTVPAWISAFKRNIA